jgi:hypothetical protein
MTRRETTRTERPSKMRWPDTFPKHAREFLEERGITAALAEGAQLRYADADEASGLVGHPIDRKPDGSVVISDGIVISQHDSVVVRWLNPEATPKYKNQPDSTNSFYLAPGPNWQRYIVKNPAKPVIFTEGQFKAIIGGAHGHNVISINGVDNWVTDGKPIIDFTWFDWNGRTVIICFDSDVTQKHQVQRALRKLADYLAELGAVVMIKVLPTEPDGKKNGLDDYITRHGAEAFAALPEIPITDRQFDEWGAHPATRELNQTLCMVPISGVATILIESPHPKFPGAKHYDLARPHAVEPRYLNQLHKIGMKGIKNPVPIMHNAFDIWLCDKARRDASAVTFAPDKPPGLDRDTGVFNLWQGLGVQPIEPDRKHSWARLKAHIAEIVANGNAEHAAYILNWMAWCLQNLAKLPEVALAFLGGEGSGKGIVFRAYCKLHGPHSMQLVQSNQLVGNFNDHLKDKLCVFADEAFFAGDHKAASALKSIITEPEKIVEPKNVNAFAVSNFTRLMISSNNMRAIDAAADARRYAVFDVPNTRRGDHQYFAAIGDELEQGGYSAMLYELQHRDVSNFDPRRLPRTSALFDQKRLSFDFVENWWYERLLDGALPTKLGGNRGPVVTCEDWTAATWVPRDYIHEHIQQGNISGYERRSLETTVGMALHKMCPSMNDERRSHDKQQKRGYLFPTLKACREAFEEYVHAAVDWKSGSGKAV